MRSPLRSTVRTAAASLLLAAGLLAAGTQTPAVAAVPHATAETAATTAATTAAGVGTAEYDLGDTAFTDPESGTVSEVRAVVHYPRHLTGRLPLVVMSHGSWYACDDADAQTWPCPAGSHPYPSYRGYDYLGRALAERGFVVVSLSADAINMTSFDYGDRARLINEHLRLWRDLANGGGALKGRFTDPATGRAVAPAFTGHVDMTRVGTLGHSRGGKGAMWQASDKHRAEWPTGVRVKAVLALAPVKFDYPEGENSDTLDTKVPFAVVTSTCDGAVHEQGQEYLDDIAGLNTVTDFSVSLQHANHNYYNRSWTPPASLGEDDSTCPAQELTPAHQQDALTAYAVAFYRYELYADPTGLPVLTGRHPLPHTPATTRIALPAPTS
ncbi:alpha/beta hydrolase [Streptomyces sp. NPDC088910]|uniref:alpha/beta hydrolase n=1 Tax=Streptomyces sp. NPDC088910 TaxID=3365911 RepID=UPI00382F889D